MNLYELAAVILLLNEGPLSRVRFAKTIYFVHKELVKKGFMQPGDIAYVRMPLGPVPVGFMTLADEHPDIVVIKTPDTKLAYESEEYSLDGQPDIMIGGKDDILKIVQNAINTLSARGTIELIETSHQDPSWAKNNNGANFVISKDDLKNSISKLNIKVFLKPKKKGNESDQIGAMQAALLQAMLSDIVKESTDLEHQDDD